MSIEVGGLFGLHLVWRESTERWHEDCVGAMMKQGVSVMCWGMIGLGWKGPFHVWKAETDEERNEASAAIAILEAQRVAEEDVLNSTWKSSAEWRELNQREQAADRIERYEEKYNNSPPVRILQSWNGKKYKIAKYKRGEGKVVDSWRYVQAVGRPLLWPECYLRLQANPNFVLIEDNAPSHTSHYTTWEREKEGVKKVNWPANSPDFNPIEHIWTIMKSCIQTRRGRERITSQSQMNAALGEKWARITIEEIDSEIAKLPTIMVRCIAVQGSNNLHA